MQFAKLVFCKIFLIALEVTTHMVVKKAQGKPAYVGQTCNIKVGAVCYNLTDTDRTVLGILSAILVVGVTC